MATSFIMFIFGKCDATEVFFIFSLFWVSRAFPLIPFSALINKKCPFLFLHHHTLLPNETIMIFSIPSSSTATSFASALYHRVFASRISCSLNSAGRVVWRRSYFLCASKLREMADVLDEKKTSSTISAAAAAAVASSSTSDFDQRDVAPPRTFLDALSEQGRWFLLMLPLIHIPFLFLVIIYIAFGCHVWFFAVVFVCSISMLS